MSLKKGNIWNILEVDKLLAYFHGFRSWWDLNFSREEARNYSTRNYDNIYDLQQIV